MISAAQPSQQSQDKVLKQRLSRLVHRHSHDLRNHLNLISLESELLGELVSDAEAQATITRIRGELAAMETAIKALVTKVDDPELDIVALGELIGMWRRQITQSAGPHRVMEWPAKVDTVNIFVDPNAILLVLRELGVAALKRADGEHVKASARLKLGREVVLEILEPAHDQPLSDELLKDSARLVEANGGRLEHLQDANSRGWLTTLTFAVHAG